MSHSSVSDMDVTWHMEDVLEDVSDVPSIIERSEELLLKSPEEDQGNVAPGYEVITEEESSILDSDSPVTGTLPSMPLDLSMKSTTPPPTVTCGSLTPTTNITTGSVRPTVSCGNLAPTTNITTGSVRFTDHPDYSGGHTSGNPSTRLGDRAAFHTWGVSPAALPFKKNTVSKMEVGSGPSPAMHQPCGSSRVVGVSDKVLPELAPLIRRFGRKPGDGKKMAKRRLATGQRRGTPAEYWKNGARGIHHFRSQRKLPACQRGR